MNNSRRTNRLSDGFTLIELLVAMAILGIVVAVAIPAYTNQVVKSNRAEAKTVLMQTAQALERCYTRYSAYDADDCPVSFPIDSETGKYSMPAADQTIGTSTYTLTAVPQGAQSDRDSECEDFTLTENGTRDISSTTGTVEDCW